MSKKTLPPTIIAYFKPILLFLLIGGVPLFLYANGISELLTSKESLQQFIDSMGVWDEAVFTLLQAVQVIIPPIPGTALNILGGYLYGTFLGVVYSTIGTTIGSYIAFLMSREFGKSLADRFVSKRVRERFDDVLHYKGNFIVFLIFFIPGLPKDYLCFILGLGHLSTSSFLTIQCVGRLFGTVLETMGGDFLRHRRYPELLILTGGAVIIGIIVLFIMAFRSKIGLLLRAPRDTKYGDKKAKHREDKTLIGGDN